MRPQRRLHARALPVLVRQVLDTCTANCPHHPCRTLEPHSSPSVAAPHFSRASPPSFQPTSLSLLLLRLISTYFRRPMQGTRLAPASTSTRAFPPPPPHPHPKVYRIVRLRLFRPQRLWTLLMVLDPSRRSFRGGACPLCHQACEENGPSAGA